MGTYKPLFMYVAPASIPQIVAHIQKYLEENPILSDPESIAEAIRDYIEEHPELIAVASVNGKTGAVVLTGEDININATTESTIATQITNLASMISRCGNDIDTINDNIEDIYGELDGTDGIKARLTVVETDINDATNGIKVRLSGIEGEVNGTGGIDSRLTTVENDINAAQTGIKARLTDVETDVSSLQTRMTQAKTDIDNNESSIESLNTNVGTLQTFCNTLSGNVSNIETKLGAIDGAYHVVWGPSVSFSLKPGQHALVLESSIFYTVWRGGDGLVTNYYVDISGGTTKVSDMKNLVQNGDTCTISNKSGENSTFSVIVIG